MCQEIVAALGASLPIYSPDSTCPLQGYTWDRKKLSKGVSTEVEWECRDRAANPQVGPGRARIQAALWDLKGEGRLGIQLLPSGG